MREYKRYDEYQDSGVEWIGEIPENWEISKIKYEYIFFTGFTPSSGNDSYYDINGYDWLNISDIKKKYVSKAESKISDKAIREYGPKISPKNSLVFSFKLSIGKTAILKKDIYTNEALATFVKNTNNDIKYLYYIAPLFIPRNAKENIYGAKILNQRLINDALLLKPSKQEQQKIASFLDQKTAEINEIITKKEKLIDHLEKYKKSVITESITKGKLGDKYINEDGELVDEIEMKDSGIEWIGEIPKYFYETKLKYNIQTTKGYAFKGFLFTDAGIPIIKATHIKNKTIIETNDYISPEYLKEYKSVKLYKDDIIMSTVGSNPDVLESAVGQLAMVPEKYDGALLNQNTVIFRIPKNQDISKKFLFYYLTSNKFRKFLDLYAHGTANQSSLTLREVLNFPLALPKKEIQEFIIDLIDNKILYINDLIQKTKESIEKYKEYKKSLIFEAVTGKIDLRDHELKGGEEIAEHNNTSTADRKRVPALN